MSFHQWSFTECINHTWGYPGVVGQYKMNSADFLCSFGYFFLSSWFGVCLFWFSFWGGLGVLCVFVFYFLRENMKLGGERGKRWEGAWRSWQRGKTWSKYKIYYRMILNNKRVGRGHVCLGGLENVFLGNNSWNWMCTEHSCRWDVEVRTFRAIVPFKAQKMNNLEIENSGLSWRKGWPQAKVLLKWR